MQRLANVVLQLLVPPAPLLKQHKPEPFGTVPIGQVPSRAGAVHEPPALARAQPKCSAFTSCQRLPPEIVAEAETARTLSDTLASLPQVVPIRHDEKATPVAAAHTMGMPTGPVRFSV